MVMAFPDLPALAVLPTLWM